MITDKVTDLRAEIADLERNIANLNQKKNRRKKKLEYLLTISDNQLEFKFDEQEQHNQTIGS